MSSPDDTHDLRPTDQHTDPGGAPAPEEETTRPLPQDRGERWDGPPDGDTRTRNQVGVGYLIAGLVFLGISGLWLAQETGVVALDDLDLLVPILLVVVGLGGLLVALVRSGRHR
jgi:hypothetical protein